MITYSNFQGFMIFIDSQVSFGVGFTHFNTSSLYTCIQLLNLLLVEASYLLCSLACFACPYLKPKWQFSRVC